MKLSSRIQLFSTVLLLLMIILTNTAIYFVFMNMMISNEKDRVQRQTEQIAEGLQSLDMTETSSTNLLHAYLPANGMIRIIDKDGVPQITTTKNMAITDEINPSYQTMSQTVVKQIKQDRYVVSYYPMIGNDSNIVTLEVAESIQETDTTLRQLRTVLFIASLVVLIPSFLGGRALSILILKPIMTLTTTMKDIQKRGIFKKIDLEHHSKDELHEMGSTFNSMMEILENNFEKQQQFVSDASHELRTPLTVIESYASMLKRWGMKKPDVLEESVEAIYSEAVRMKEMTNQMLQLAGSDAKWKLEIEDIDMVPLCSEVIRTCSDVFQRNITLINNKDSIIYPVDKHKMKQLLFILLDNAIKYSSDDIEVILLEDQDRLFIKVKDLGMGIPESEIDSVFDRFYRVDKARNRESGGTGLGLSIAQRIANAHDANISVESREGQGTTFTIEFQERKLI
ncbi:HAMP domain-containing histidine kinase [Bacillus sp. PS06]|uniref:HAMP domain-containing sensor histidine kinase n=1 Tax=Bacillus sp. PS06 TaxID=2764176 RepID=UPI00177EC43B|nr:HAMP domain-containing histidine kinase [Bacillus sp. PS06]MBD8070520.1 HAMP domain-containing histidine kinase [Bacillus sp. PS06]